MTFIRSHFLRLAALAVAVLMTFQVHAVRESNNVYLFDVTASMLSQGLWDSAKASMFQTIESQSRTDDSHFTIIPFGNCEFKQFTFTGEQYDSKLQKKIEDYLNSIVHDSSYTHISEAFRKGFAACKPNMHNRIYLLTDGLPNGGDSSAKVAQTLDQWCANHSSARLFYVALQGGVIDRTIQAAIDRCNDAYIVNVEKGKIVQLPEITQSTINTDLSELGREFMLTLSDDASIPLKVENDDPIFNAEIVGGKSENGAFKLKITPKNGQTTDSLGALLPRDEDYAFGIAVKSNDPQYNIVNPQIGVAVANSVKTKLTLCEPGTDGYRLADAHWHDSFLWSPASDPGIAALSIVPQFEYPLPDTRVTLAVIPAEDEPADFTIFHNGKRLAAGETFALTPGDSLALAIEFNTDAKEGKRYVKVVRVDYSSLDLIDGQIADEWPGMMLQTRYEVDWNPLKTFLFWLGIILLAALILWLVYVHLFTAKIKVTTLRLSGPSSYFISKSIRGARKVTLTSKPRRQGALSRFFTGKYLYITAPHFVPEIEITPAGSKKRIKMRSAAPGWEIFPPIISQYEKAEAVNTQNSQKFTIES